MRIFLGDSAGDRSSVSSEPAVSLAQIQNLVAQLPLAAYMCDDKGFIGYYNSYAVEFWGRAPQPQEPIGSYCSAFQFYDDKGRPLPHEHCWMARALRRRRAYLGKEVTVERPDGTRRTGIVNAQPIFDENGELLGALDVVIDITDRKHAEEQFRVAVEASPSALIVVAPDGRIMLVNSQTEALFGYSREELLGQPVEMLVPERFRPRHPAYRRGFVAGPRPRAIGARRELYGRRKDGAEVPVEIGLNPIRTSNGVMVLSAIVDITERKDTERALRNSEERLREVNHSLEEKVQKRTQKLVAYQEQLRLLAAKLSASEQEERRRVAIELHDNLAQLLAICKMKLSLARRELPQLEGNPDIDSIEETIDDALKYTRSLISDLTPPFGLGRNDLVEAIKWVATKMKRHGLEVDIDDDGQPKPMEPTLLTTTFEVVRELLFNVVRHAGTDRAEVALRRDDGRVIITVSDQGAGFNAEHKPLQSNEDGGLGLFSVRERVTALGGVFGLASSPGGGTRVTVEMLLDPAGESHHHDASHGEGWEAAAAGSTDDSVQTIRVLLVDDHRMMRDGLRRIINAEPDLEVIAEASDGEMAVRLARDVRPDLIVMDVGLPKLNGIEATRRIVTDDPDARVVALSLDESEEAIGGMLRAGACDYVFKSQAFGSLCAAIRSHGRIEHNEALSA